MTLDFSEILTKTWIYFVMTLEAFRKLHEFSSCAINYFHSLFLILKSDIIFNRFKSRICLFFKEILTST